MEKEEEAPDDPAVPVSSKEDADSAREAIETMEILSSVSKKVEELVSIYKQLYQDQSPIALERSLCQHPQGAT